MSIASDVSLVTQDGQGRTSGVTLSELFAAINRSKLKEVIIILDCCFAGNAGNIPQLNLDLSALRDGVSVLTAERATKRLLRLTKAGLSRHILKVL